VLVGQGPGEPTFDSANGDIYLPVASNAVLVISGETNTVIANVTMPGSPSDLLFDSVNGDVYVPSQSGSAQGTVWVISGATNTIIANVTVGNGPRPLLLDPANGDIYVSNYGDARGRSSTVSVISGATNTVIATVPVGAGPMTPAVDSADDAIYVADSLDSGILGSVGGLVSVISGSSNSVVANVTVSCATVTPVFDPANGDVYASCGAYQAISVISPATNAVVTTARLLPGDITIEDVDQNQNPIYGSYAYLSTSGSIVATGYTPVTFGNLVYEQLYVATVESPGNCSFMSWTNDNHNVITYPNDKNSSLSIYATSDQGFVAVYNCG